MSLTTHVAPLPALVVQRSRRSVRPSTGISTSPASRPAPGSTAFRATLRPDSRRPDTEAGADRVRPRGAWPRQGRGCRCARWSVGCHGGQRDPAM